MNRLIVGLVIFACLILFIESNQRPAECELAHEIGPCRALIPAYYYDPLADQCILFYYGGCSGMNEEKLFVFHNEKSLLGNENRFETKSECESRCANGIQRTNG